MARAPGQVRSPTWLCTVLSWLLKVMVRLVEVLGATWVMKGVLLWLTVSYMFTRRLQISMFWKQDFTLRRGGVGGDESQYMGNVAERCSVYHDCF